MSVRNSAFVGAISIYLEMGMLFTFMIAAGYLWNRKPAFVKLGMVFAFVYAAWSRFLDWRAARAKARAEKQRELERQKTQRAVPSQLLPAKRPAAIAPATNTY